MTRLFGSTLSAVVMAGLVTVSAQAQREQRPNQQPRAKPITVTGCLQKSSPKTTQGSTAPYVLKDAEGGTSTMYALLPAPGADLGAHVNHKVSVTAMMGQTARDGGGAARTPGNEKAAPAGDMPTLAVESVKMLANSCAAAGR